MAETPNDDSPSRAPFIERVNRMDSSNSSLKQIASMFAQAIGVKIENKFVTLLVKCNLKCRIPYFAHNTTTMLRGSLAMAVDTAHTGFFQNCATIPSDSRSGSDCGKSCIQVQEACAS